MATPLRVLLLEASEMDAHLVLNELSRHKFEVHWQRVETRDGFTGALEQSWDVILADYSLPQFDALSALEILSEKSLEVPFIVLTDAVGEEKAVECMHRGAYDYLLKDRMARLGTAVEHAWERRNERIVARLKGDLADMIVHDLRTPLTSLLCGLETIGILGELNPDQKETINISVSSGLLMLHMINDLLDISKMEESALQLDYQALQAEPLVKDAVRLVEAIADYKRLRLEAPVPVDLPVFQGDHDKLLRTLVNLLSNAIKFTSEVGQVNVNVRLAPEFTVGNRARTGLIFSVADTGEGIPPEAQERIFDKFWQVSSRKPMRRMSSGLGLTFCKMAVESHGGRIWVESEIGRGSTFSFFIPLVPD